jgi:hypothetical protein
MRRLLIAGVLSCALTSCASNKASEEEGARIHDSTLTPQDTTNPNDTLPHIRDSMPDSTR